MSTLAVFMGRFSPCHDGHLHVIKEACKSCDQLLILVGSSGEARDMRNPWTYGERVAMLKLAVSDADLSDKTIHYRPIYDHLYQDNLWKQQVQSTVRDLCDDPKNVKLFGYSKDESTWYLKEFPQWGKPVEVEQYQLLNATSFRDSIFDETIDVFSLDGLSKRVQMYLHGFKLSDEYQYIVKEYAFQKSHDDMWSEAPYPSTFNTVDSLVIQSGHILLVQRKNHPGKDRMALPGGYLNPSERQMDGAIRELREETQLKIPEKVLKGSLCNQDTFDDPKRSTRGRVITRVFHFALDDSQSLPHIKGSDDALKAKWITLDDFVHMREQMFEDHFHIIKKMLNI